MLPKQSFHLVIHLILDFNFQQRIKIQSEHVKPVTSSLTHLCFQLLKISSLSSQIATFAMPFFFNFCLESILPLNRFFKSNFCSILCVPITGGRAQPKPIRLFCYLEFSNQTGDDVIFHPSLHDSAFVAREQLLLLSLRISTFWPYNTLFCLRIIF